MVSVQAEEYAYYQLFRSIWRRNWHAEPKVRFGLALREAFGARVKSEAALRAWSRTHRGPGYKPKRKRHPRRYHRWADAERRL